MSGLILNKINKIFGDTQILHDVDLQIADGEFVVFVGPSGCGKSTLLRLIAGLEEASSGQIQIGGRVVNDLTPKERGVGMVFQSYALYPHMNVYDNIAFGLQLAKHSRDSIRERVLRTAKVLQLDHLLERKPKELSGGQRQRVAIGRAMAREPSLLLFDEPLSNLDAALRVQMRSEIAKLHQRIESTMIYVTHDQVEAMTLADKIVVLNGGRVEQVGTPQAVYEHPQTTFVATFIGSPKMNLISGQLLATGADSTEVDIAGLGRISVAVNSERAQPGDAVQLGIRPEHLQLLPASAQQPGLEAQTVEYLGNESFIYLTHPSADDLLLARSQGPSQIKPGQQLRLTVDADLCHLFDSEGQAFTRTRAHQMEALSEAV